MTSLYSIAAHPRIVLPFRLTIAFLFSASVAAFAGDGANKQGSSGDPDWNQVQASLDSPRSRGGKTDVAGTRKDRAASYRDAADQAKAYRQKHPNDPKAKEAKRLEAKSLLDASLAGDDTDADRAAALVAEVRGDKDLPAKDRVELAELAEIVRQKPFMGDAKKLRAAREDSARRLIAEFPDEEEGYVALLRCADNDPDQAKALAEAREIVASGAPPSIKSVAQHFVARQSLIGQSLLKLANAALGAGNPIESAKGRPIILYTWATWSLELTDAIVNLAGPKPSDSYIVGLCLDRSNIPSAREFAKTKWLPGTQIYSDDGLENPLAQQLGLARPNLVCVTNSEGTIKRIETP